MNDRPQQQRHSAALNNGRRSRLDRLMINHLGIRKAKVQLLLAQRRIQVDGQVIENGELIITGFNRVSLDEKALCGHPAVYLMLHKPRGVLSATHDDKHPVAISLVQHPAAAELHIAGRLDLHSSGLLLLTNDGQWSRQLSKPQNNVSKVYEVTVKNPLQEEYIAAFEQGMYFGYEDITTRPAKLEILGSNHARVSLQEGRYHQIKRMFGRFRNPVLSIHRVAIGALLLDATLQPGEWRPLSIDEVHRVLRNEFAPSESLANS